MNNSRTEFRQLVRLPRDVKDFLKREAERNCGSQNSEIVRSIRARMDAGEQRERAAG
jgi:Arc-like DNA binding domain